MESLNPNKISSGNAELDRWLSGGYDRDIITAIYGPAGCGKTNFCMMAAANAAKQKEKVVFIDTEGGFSAERFKQLTNSDADASIGNVLLLKPTNFDEQWGSFERLLKEIRSGNRISLIIVDGMTMLYRLLMAESRNDKDKIDEINSKLVRQLRILSEIARKKNIPVLITNQVYYNFLSESDLKAGKEKHANMVGGDILKYWSKCIIELKAQRGKRIAILRKHRSLPEKDFGFEIYDAGIRKKGWL